MGCCSDKDRPDHQKAETLIKVNEVRLQLSHIKAGKIITSCKKIEKGKFFQDTDLNLLYEALETNEDSPLSKFLHCFHCIKSCGYDTLKLYTAIVLLCKGKRIEKLKYLFETYLEKASSTLSVDNIQLLVSNIFEISILFLSSFASHYVKDNMIIENYKAELNSAYFFILNHYTKLITDSVAHDNIDFPSFARAFTFSDISFLLNPDDLRRQVLMLTRRVKKAKIFIDILMVNGEEMVTSVEELPGVLT